MVQPDGDRVLHVTEPHGQQEVVLVEDKATDVLGRLYTVTDSEGNRLSFTGWELESLSNWWMQEEQRNGTDEELP